MLGRRGADRSPRNNRLQRTALGKAAMGRFGSSLLVAVFGVPDNTIPGCFPQLLSSQRVDAAPKAGLRRFIRQSLLVEILAPKLEPQMPPRIPTYRVISL